MKNQYNVIKEKLEQGFLPHVRDRQGYYSILTGFDDDEMWGTVWESDPQDSKRHHGFNDMLWTEEEFNQLDLEIVEYFRPNDLFPSKPFEKGDTIFVDIKKLRKSDYFCSEDLSFLESEDLVVNGVDQNRAGLEYCCYSASKGDYLWLGEQYVYPRIEKQEECRHGVRSLGTLETMCPGCSADAYDKKKPEDIIGEASKKALEDAGYTITKK